jgi:AAA15 family ATPase/GTPase
MINNIAIQRFKGIKQCNIDDLGRINLLLGRNDSCKSTILEAIYYTLKELSENSLENLFRRRTNVFTGAQELWYNYDLHRPINIQLEIDQSLLNMEIVSQGTYPREFWIETQTTLKNMKQKAEDRVRISESRYRSDLTNIHRLSSGTSENLLRNTKLKPYFEQTKFIDSSERNDIQSTESVLGKIKLEVKAEEFGKYLFSMYGRGRLWEFLPHPIKKDEYHLAFMDAEKPIFLSGMGDGIRYGMQIIGNVIISEKTVILVEEIESNQHPESLKLLIDFLIETAFKNDIQLFVTTHSDLAMQYFWYHFRGDELKEEPRAKEVRYLHVERNDKTGEVTCNSFDPHNTMDRKRVMGDIYGTGNQ